MMRSRRVRPWGPAWGGAAAACVLLPTFGIDACGSGVELETRTFEVQHMSPGEAVEMVRPYVYTERANAPGSVSYFSSGITVRETPEALARIEAALERYDIAKPGVRLHFQLIEADGFTETDPEIEEVREALEELFRFEGYRLVGEAQLALMEGTNSRQPLPAGFELFGQVEEVRGAGARGSVTISVVLQPRGPGPDRPHITTTLAVPIGETVVLGSSKASVSAPTTILTVRPEFVRLPEN